MGCQKDIAKKIIEKDGDYLLALKSNQKSIEDKVKNKFSSVKSSTKNLVVTKDKNLSEGHGRIETREVKVISSMDGSIKGVDLFNKWGINSIVEVKSSRLIKTSGELTENCRYFISSAIKTASEFSINIREHWEIENCLHWRLDVIMNEDQCRSRVGHSANNFSILRHMALNLLKSESSKKSIRRKINIAAWDEKFLLKVLLNDGRIKNFDA
jgi:predicted transposase YbfD/YdcC